MKFAKRFYKCETHKKGTFLVEPGQYIRDFHFMKKGCVTYYTIENGTTRVMEFFTGERLLWKIVYAEGVH